MLFAVKIYQNDYVYLKKNYTKITVNNMRHDLLLITVAFVNNIDKISFIIDKFKIDVNLLIKMEIIVLFAHVGKTINWILLNI